MKFYNREKEMSKLKEIQKLSLKNAQFTVVTGRRRIGKTHLLLHATAGQPTLYYQYDLCDMGFRRDMIC